MKQRATDLGEHASNQVISNHSELPNTTLMVVIHCGLNNNDNLLYSMQLRASYPNGRHQDELNDFLNNHSGPNESYIVTLFSMSTLEKYAAATGYMALYTYRQIMHHPIYGQISYNCCL